MSSDDPYTISKFMDLLIANLVLKNVREINVIGISPGSSSVDRQGLHAMYATAKQAVEAYADNPEGNSWFHFIVRVRNELSPDHQGSFSGFRSELIQKTATLVSLSSPHDGIYHLDVSKPHAESILRGGHPDMLLYVDGLATAFVLGREKAPV